MRAQRSEPMDGLARLLWWANRFCDEPNQSNLTGVLVVLVFLDGLSVGAVDPSLSAGLFRWIESRYSEIGRSAAALGMGVAGTNAPHASADDTIAKLWPCTLELLTPVARSFGWN